MSLVFYKKDRVFSYFATPSITLHRMASTKDGQTELVVEVKYPDGNSVERKQIHKTELSEERAKVEMDDMLRELLLEQLADMRYTLEKSWEQVERLREELRKK